MTPQKKRHPGSMLIVLLTLAGCAPAQRFYSPTPVARETITRPIIQYSLANVSPEGWSSQKESLKVYLDIETGPATYPRGGTYTKLMYRTMGTIALSTSDVDVAFAFTHTSMSADDARQYVSSGPLALSLVFKNKGARVITVDWNSVVLTDELGRALRVIHRGVKLSDAAASMAPSIVPPGSILEDFIYPSEGIRYNPGRYGGWYGPLFFETKKPNTHLKLYLPLKLGAAEKAYTFTFGTDTVLE